MKVQKTENTVIIFMDLKEGEQLTNELISSVGLMRKPKKISEKLTDELSELFPEA